MSDEKPVYKRRVRYSGTHPKKYNEKYKELNPDKYKNEIEKVKSRGQTPIGSHRPICVEEICTVLDLKPGMRGIDCTLGFGGHSETILSHISPNGKLIAFDIDIIELKKTEKRFRDLGINENNFLAFHKNFADIAQCMDLFPDGVDFILADLGVSSMQLDVPDRGFSFKNPAPLDLRLDSSNGETASELINRISADALINLLIENSDEPFAETIGNAIKSQINKCLTTDGLALVITKSLQNKKVLPSDIKASIQRSFQALRIAVNNEFESLDKLLAAIPGCLKSNGRIAILSFHSGEDRRVKKSFKENVRNGSFSECVRRPIRPSFQEKNSNPRSSCAKLRWAIKQ